MQTITLERFYHGPNFPHLFAGTLGVLTLPSGITLFTVERPWLSNEPFVSCVPEGVYRLKRRRSGVVKRSTNEEYLYGWQLTSVPGRTHIMIHPGNWPSDFQGCIGVGLDYRFFSDGKIGVGSSRQVFKILMGELHPHGNYEIEITTKRSIMKV